LDQPCKASIGGYEDISSNVREDILFIIFLMLQKNV